MYREISMSQRLDRVGELLAKGVYLYAKKQKMTAQNDQNKKPPIRPKNGVKRAEKAVRKRLL